MRLFKRPAAEPTTGAFLRSPAWRAVILAAMTAGTVSCAGLGETRPGPAFDQRTIDAFNSTSLSTGCRDPREECDSPPQLVGGLNPGYPREELINGITGVVFLRFVVKEDGTPADIWVESATNDDFAKAALAAARTWKFTPAQLKGKPVRRPVRLPVDFRI